MEQAVSDITFGRSSRPDPKQASTAARDDATLALLRHSVARDRAKSDPAMGQEPTTEAAGNAAGNDDSTMERSPDEEVEAIAGIEFGAYDLDTPLRSSQEWAAEFSSRAMMLHIADRTLRMTKPELIAFIRDAGERVPETPEIMFRGIDGAQETFEGWGKMLGVAQARYIVAASAACLEPDASGNAEAAPPKADPAAPVENAFPPAPTDLAGACLWAVQHRAWIDQAALAMNWPDERGDAEAARTNAVFTRAINEPSADLREITAKAALALEDFERFTIISPDHRQDDGTRIVHTVLREVAALSDTPAHANPVDWDDAPPGFMAYPEREPVSFLNIPEGVKLELQRLYGIALDEYERCGGPDMQPEAAERLRQKLRLSVLGHAICNEASEAGNDTQEQPRRPIDFGPDTHVAELAAEFCRVYGRHAAKDRAHMAGELAEAEWLPSYHATVALMEKLEATQPKTLLGTALKCLGAIGVAGWNARADGSTDGMDPWERVGVQFQDALMADALAPFSVSGPDLVGLIDFQTTTMDELRAVLDTANEVGMAAYAMTWTGRCMVQGSGGDLNAAGRLMQWIGDALANVETAAINEARSRDPARDNDRTIRLDILARSIIQSGDKAETAAFARELLAFAEA